MRIAVYTIAKNEEQFVKRWYESAKDADYLFILDTGSTDNTVALAQELGIDVEIEVIDPWRFDTARNLALGYLPHDIDYCIALDMDEVLVEGWRGHLYNPYRNNITRPRYKYTWSWKEDGTPGLQYGGDKIHSRYGFEWKHPVHEVLTAQSETQDWCGLEIHHFPDQTKSRGQYFPLLQLAVQEDPDDDRNSHYLAREYFFHDMYEEAKKEFIRHLSLPRATWKPERSASMRYLAKCDSSNRLYWLLRASKECPDRREAWVELAKYFYEKEKWKQCFYAATQALNIKEKPLEYICDQVAWGSAPHDYAAIAAYRLEFYHEAYFHGANAAKISPSDQRLQDNLKFYLQKVGDNGAQRTK